MQSPRQQGVSDVPPGHLEVRNGCLFAKKVVSFKPRNVTMIRKLFIDARHSLQMLLIRMIQWEENTPQFTLLRVHSYHTSVNCLVITFSLPKGRSFHTTKVVMHDAFGHSQLQKRH